MAFTRSLFVLFLVAKNYFVLVICVDFLDILKHF